MIKNTYLVTGGAGFIGSYFIKYLLKKYSDEINIVNVDKLTYAGNLENLKEIKQNSNYKFIQADICDKSAISKIFKDNNITFVVNFAAESHVDRSINSAKEFVETNILGTLNLLECARVSWQNSDETYPNNVKFMHISTDEVYGSLGDTGYFTELTNIDPHSPYSASKAGSDLLVKSFFDTHKLPINISRCSNNYGPNQFPEKLIPLIMDKCNTLSSIPVYGDGLNVRDWLYVEDHCKAIDLIINKGKIGEVYNIGGHNEKTNIQIVKLMIEYINKSYDERVSNKLITYVQDRKGHDRRYAIDSSKISKDLGWFPETKFEDGIKITIDWYMNNKDWLDHVKDGSYKKWN